MPASRRRKAIQSYGRGKVHTLHLVVPCKKKCLFDGTVTRKKVRLTAGDLVSFGKLPGTYSANLAGETSRYMIQLELQLQGARTTHKDVGGDYFHGKQPDIGELSGRAIFAPFSPDGRGWVQSTEPASTNSSGASPCCFRSPATCKGCRTPA